LKNNKTLQQFKKRLNSIKIVQHPKVHLEFLFKVHILEILESQRVCI